MAAFIARKPRILFSPSPLLRATAHDSSSSVTAAAAHGGGSSFRRASSSSSSSSPPSSNSSKPEKKLVDRLSGVIDAVNDRKLPPELRGQRNAVRCRALLSILYPLLHSMSETDIMNVVEQRIWHSMEEGGFENLAGKGKPLKLDSSNPHADPAEDTLYRILSKNNCAPEWVELNKEIRNQICEWRSSLKKASRKCNNGDAVGDYSDNSDWIQASEALKMQLKDINNKVFRYNLIVPFGRQMFGFKWEKELDRLDAEE